MGGSGGGGGGEIEPDGDDVTDVLKRGGDMEDAERVGEDEEGMRGGGGGGIVGEP